MRNSITGRDLLAKEICDVLGLKHVRKLDIHMAYDEIITVTAEFFPEVDGVKQFIPILKKFELVEKKPEDLNEFRHWRKQEEPT